MKRESNYIRFMEFFRKDYGIHINNWGLAVSSDEDKGFAPSVRSTLPYETIMRCILNLLEIFSHNNFHPGRRQLEKMSYLLIKNSINILSTALKSYPEVIKMIEVLDLRSLKLYAPSSIFGWISNQLAEVFNMLRKILVYVQIIQQKRFR